jgi:hypothetical protein
LKVLLLTIYLNCKAKQVPKRKKNGLLRRLFLKDTPPPRGYQIDAASFLYPQGTRSAAACLNGRKRFIAWNSYLKYQNHFL